MQIQKIKTLYSAFFVAVLYVLFFYEVFEAPLDSLIPLEHRHFVTFIVGLPIVFGLGHFLGKVVIYLIHSELTEKQKDVLINKNFSGAIASFLVTTLFLNVTLTILAVIKLFTD